MTLAGVFSDLTMVWEEPVKTLLELMQLVNLDLSILRVQCIVPGRRCGSFRSVALATAAREVLIASDFPELFKVRDPI